MVTFLCLKNDWRPDTIQVYQCQSCGFSYFRSELQAHALDDHNVHSIAINYEI